LSAQEDLLLSSAFQGEKAKVPSTFVSAESRVKMRKMSLLLLFVMRNRDSSMSMPRMMSPLVWSGLEFIVRYGPIVKPSSSTIPVSMTDIEAISASIASLLRELKVEIKNHETLTLVESKIELLDLPERLIAQLRSLTRNFDEAMMNKALEEAKFYIAVESRWENYAAFYSGFQVGDANLASLVFSSSYHIGFTGATDLSLL
jgi:hypothetical protein